MPGSATDSALGARSVLSADDRAALAALAAQGVELRLDAPMSRRTTLRLGGPADALAMPDSRAALVAVIKLCVARGLPITVIGGGSNLLVRDGGVRGVVIATRKLRAVRRLDRAGDHDSGDQDRGDQAGENNDDKVDVEVECGLSTGKLLSLATEWELGGLEFLGGVPGSVGGGMRMNAGTYLGEFKDVTKEVVCVRMSDGELIARDAAECGFGYRRSAIPSDELVVAATLSLGWRARADIEADVRALRQRRHEREPKRVSNSGSTFKNPAGDYAGRLIEACGLKGTRVGGAECSPAHANWLVNTGTATASDLLALIELVRERVQAQHGVTLELEVKIIGED